MAPARRPIKIGPRCRIAGRPGSKSRRPVRRRRRVPAGTRRRTQFLSLCRVPRAWKGLVRSTSNLVPEHSRTQRQDQFNCGDSPVRDVGQEGRVLHQAAEAGQMGGIQEVPVELGDRPVDGQDWVQLGWVIKHVFTHILSYPPPWILREMVNLIRSLMCDNLWHLGLHQSITGVALHLLIRRPQKFFAQMSLDEGKNAFFGVVKVSWRRFCPSATAVDARHISSPKLPESLLSFVPTPRLEDAFKNPFSNPPWTPPKKKPGCYITSDKRNQSNATDDTFVLSANR